MATTHFLIQVLFMLAIFALVVVAIVLLIRTLNKAIQYLDLCIAEKKRNMESGLNDK